MSFYITLPSNSPNIFDNNTQSCFSTLLGSPLNLKGDYEVALSDINFTKNFKVDLGSFKVSNTFNDKFWIVTLQVENGISLENYCSS